MLDMSVQELFLILQNELDYSGEDAAMSPRLQHQHSQPTAHFTNPSTQVSSGSFGQATVGPAPQSWHSDQAKNSVFSNALSSPVRQSLQPFQLAQGGYYQNNVLPTGNATARNQETNFPHQNRDPNNCSSNDSSMDMHEESPTHEPY